MTLLPKFAQEKGCRTIVLFPDDYYTQIAPAVQYKPNIVPSFIAYRSNNQFTQYSIEDSLIAQLKQVQSNKIEFQKIFAEAQKLKPQRLDQMASEDVFTLKQSECLQDFQQSSENYDIGEAALKLPPESNKTVHRLFTSGGHLNYYFNKQIFPTTYALLLQRYIEKLFRVAVSSIPKQETVDVQMSETAQKVMNQLEKQPDATASKEDVNYDTVTPQTTNIYGNGGRTCIPHDKIPLFHKRRRLDCSVYPDDIQQYIITLILPDDISHQELRVWHAVLLDQLKFAGIQLICRSTALIGVTGKSGIAFQSSLNAASFVSVDPFYPVLNQLYAPMTCPARAMLFGLQEFTKMTEQLPYCRQTLGFAVDALDIAAGCGSYQNAFERLGVPEQLVRIYSGLSADQQFSILQCILLQAELQLQSLFAQQAFSLNPIDNYQSMFKLSFPIPAACGSDAAVADLPAAYQISVRFGPAGLAAARLLFNQQAVPETLRSGLFAHGAGPRDPLLEQRDVPKTTKVQLEKHEIGDIIFNGRRILDFNEALSQSTTIVNCSELSIVFIQFLQEAHLRNEVFMRSLGRRVEEQKNIITEQQEQMNSRQKVTELAQNMQFSGYIARVGGFREQIAEVMRSIFQGFEPTKEPLLAQNDGEMWLSATLLALTDGMLENTACRQEIEQIGCRVWIEKAPFLYP